MKGPENGSNLEQRRWTIGCINHNRRDKKITNSEVLLNYEVLEKHFMSEEM